MPQLRFRGVEVDTVETISTALVDELQRLLDCPRDDLTLEVVSSVYVADGQRVAGYPFIEVLWFDRGQALQDLTAMAITRHLQAAGVTASDIFFTPLKGCNYYENGTHF
ncbi:DUF1904 domain-containing protein [Motiliproteus sediminis]|uniref:DUF1904 domain-containing protein n=1 Tax=Motiliproteus sediminis TaxID=1468178 RepID=UPI001AEFDC9B|nr:DUF1904 domain-containing protein [Motiliproteus sediminis]